MISIIGGKFKKKNIQVPIKQVRPTSAIKREAIFSILESYAIKKSYDLYKNKCFIDLYAGTGSLGLEAISRGAFISYFYEINEKVLEVLTINCKSLCQSNEYFIYNKDINTIKELKIKKKLSAIFIDPPYDINPFEKILITIINSNILNENTVIVIETKINNVFKIPIQLKLLKEKKYGKTKIIFLKKLR